MAHYKRRRPRTCATHHAFGSARGKRPDYDWMAHWPRWWDVVFHTRPKRRRDKVVTGRVMRGVLDPDAAIWDLGNHRPHNYFW